MLHKVEENTDWKSKYQGVINDLEARELEWSQIEELLRKTIGRLSIAGRGIDEGLDTQLRTIQTLSREKRDEKLAVALNQLTEVVASLEGTQTTDAKQRRSDPIMLMFELLQNIHFNAEQRGQLKSICSELLVSVAKGHDRDSVSVYIQKLSVLINENFDNLDSDSKSVRIVLQLLEWLELGEPEGERIREQFRDIQDFRDQELKHLADLINAQINPSVKDSSIDQVMTSLLERLAVIQVTDGATQEIQAQVDQGFDDDQWPDTLNRIVDSIADALKNLEHEKQELESFIVNVTAQLGDVSQAISEDHREQEVNREDTLALQSFVEEGMELIQKNVQSKNDLHGLKSEISKNVEEIRDGVDGYADRLNERHDATAERNLKLTEQLSQMEQETLELQVLLEENRAKLLYDALTGVYSRMAYDERFAQELARWTRYQTPFSYVILSTLTILSASTTPTGITQETRR